MTGTEMFGITLFDQDQYMTWASRSPEERFKMYLATEENRTSAISWTGIYKPDPKKVNSALNEPLTKALDGLQHQAAQSGHLPMCVIINASQHPDEKDIIQTILSTTSNYDAQGCLKQRIFGVSIGGSGKTSANPYFLHYLSSISRGKTVQIADWRTARRELNGLLSEMESPLVKDLKLNIGFNNKQSKFIAPQMMHPYPIPDLYEGHPVLLKITLPNDGQYEIESIHVNGNGMGNSLTEYTIPVTFGQDDMKSDESFPMELALAESHLNHLHGNIWVNNDGFDNDVNDRYLNEANAISDVTGIPSPTRALQSVQERVDLEQNEDSAGGDHTSSHHRKRSTLSLPPRTGRGSRRKKNVSNKAKAGAIGAGAMLGSVAVVSVFNPFEDVVFGAPNEAMGEDCCNDCCCICCGDNQGMDGDCDECCEHCTIM